MNRATVDRIAIALAAATLLGGAAVAQTTTAVARTDEAAGAAQLSKVRVTVKAIDLAKRELTIQHEDGIVEPIVVGDAVQRLDEVKVGDTIDIEHYESLTLALDKKPGAAPAATGEQAEARTEAGELPGGVRVTKVTINAKVTAIDAKTNKVTLTGPQGNSVVLDAKPETVAKLKVNDMVEAVYTQALAVAVSRVTKSEHVPRGPDTSSDPGPRPRPGPNFFYPGGSFASSASNRGSPRSEARSVSSRQTLAVPKPRRPPSRARRGHAPSGRPREGAGQVVAEERRRALRGDFEARDRPLESLSFIWQWPSSLPAWMSLPASRPEPGASPPRRSGRALARTMPRRRGAKRSFGSSASALRSDASASARFGRPAAPRRAPPRRRPTRARASRPGGRSRPPRPLLAVRRGDSQPRVARRPRFRVAAPAAASGASPRTPASGRSPRSSPAS